MPDPKPTGTSEPKEPYLVIKSESYTEKKAHSKMLKYFAWESAYRRMESCGTNTQRMMLRRQ